MEKHTHGSLEYFTFDVFAPHRDVTCFVTTRAGGMSHGAHAGLNLGMRSGDDPDTVVDNRAQLSLLTGAFPELLTFGGQVHGDRVGVVTGDTIGSGALDTGTAIPDTDALVTQIPDAPLVVLVADCAAVALFDPVQRAAGIAHAGWRGTVAGIAARTVVTMAERFGSRPADLVAGIGPAIGPCCFEVGEDVAARFREIFPDDSGYVVIPRDPQAGTRPRVDLWRANAVQLGRAGVRKKNIETAGLCTSCRTDLFYSHRRESPRDGAGRSGRFAAVILLNERTRRPY